MYTYIRFRVPPSLPDFFETGLYWIFHEYMSRCALTRLLDILRCGVTPHNTPVKRAFLKAPDEGIGLPFHSVCGVRHSCSSNFSGTGEKKCSFYQGRQLKSPINCAYIRRTFNTPIICGYIRRTGKKTDTSNISTYDWCVSHFLGNFVRRSCKNTKCAECIHI